MTALWIAVALITALSLVLMLRPLSRKAKTARPTRADFDLTVYKDQLAEVDRDMDRGVLTEDQALAARTEIERRMLAAAQDKDSTQDVTETHNPKAAMALMVAVVVAVPLGAVGLYLHLGAPEMKDHPLAERMRDMQTAQDGLSPEERAHDRERARQLMAELEQRLAENPDDIEGWLVAAQIYETQQRYTKAAEAYEKVAGLTNRHPQALAAWAETLIVAENTIVLPQAVELLREVKEKDSSDPRSYFYLALERQQKGDLQGALDEYVALLRVSPSDAEWVSQIIARVQGLASEMDIAMPEIAMLPPQGPPPGMTAGDMPHPPGGPMAGPGPTAEQVEEAQQMSEEDQNAMIQAMVQRLADRMKENPDDLAGWRRLAQAYGVLGNAEGVAEAEANIKRLSGQ